MNKVNTQAAYILHKRAYRETSQILEIFTRDYGRVALMSKGSRTARSKTNGLLQNFQPLVISWQGRGDLPYLKSVEMANCKPAGLQGNALLSALYLNELLINLLHKNDVHEKVFDQYHNTIFELQSAPHLDLHLRKFEKDLLEHLGFALNLLHDADTGEVVRKDEIYAYHFEHGPVSSKSRISGSCPLVSGESLVNFHKNSLTDKQQKAEIKLMMRYILSHHLGGKKLKSRELFRRSSGASLKS